MHDTTGSGLRAASVSSTPAALLTPTDVSNALNELIEGVRTLCLRGFGFYFGRRGRVSLNQAYYHWDGGRNRYGEIRKCLWPDFTYFLIAQQINPFEYLETLLSGRGHDPVEPPQDLMGEEALQHYRKRAPDRLRWIRCCLSSAIGLISSERTLLYKNDDPISAYRRGVIMHTRKTPMLRYCLATASFPDLVTPELRSEARLEYVFEKAIYDVLLWDIVPAELDAETRAIFDAIAT